MLRSHLYARIPDRENGACLVELVQGDLSQKLVPVEQSGISLGRVASMSQKKWEFLRGTAQMAQSEGRYAEAEMLWLAALEEAEVMGLDNPALVLTLESLAAIYFHQDKYWNAAPIGKRLLALYHRKLGSEHLDVGVVATNLAIIYHSWKKYADAEPMYRLALGIKRAALGEDHPDVLFLKQSYNDALKAAAATKSGRWTMSGNWHAIAAEPVFSTDELLLDKGGGDESR